MPNYLTVAKIVNTHGLRGELKVIAQTDFPEERFAEGSRLTLFPPENAKKSPFEVEIAHTRIHKQSYIIRLAGFDQIEQVQGFKGGQLKVPQDQLQELPEGEYYYYQIIGCQVFSEEGEDLGKVVEILSPGANDVWVVKAEGAKDLLIPVIDDVVLHVDTEQKQIRIHLMEGLRE